MLRVLYLTLVVSFSIGAQHIRVVTEHLPPYQISEKGKLVGGISYLVMKEVFMGADLNPRIEVLPWARAYKIATEQKNVIIFSLVRSPKREAHFRWIGQLRRMNYGFFSSVSRPSIKIKNTDDARNYMVVTVRGSFEASSLKRLGFEKGKNLIYTVDYESAWSMLRLGRADLFYGNAPIVELSDTLRQASEQFKKHPFIVESYDVFVAASIHTDDAIAKRLSDAFDMVKKDPHFKGLFNMRIEQDLF